MSFAPLEIVYQDEHLVAINKPHGLLVHRSKIAADAEVFALQMLRDQLNQYVSPIHRLDRKTSGVLIFALNQEVLSVMQQQLATQSVNKRYVAIVRGYFPENIVVDHPLTNDSGKTQEAVTEFNLLYTAEIDVPFGKHDTSRYSLIEAFPKTGRMHQIRKHCNHLRHPIIGDRPHGCNKQNKLFKEMWDMTSMMLHGAQFECRHPITNQPLNIKANWSAEFERTKSILNL